MAEKRDHPCPKCGKNFNKRFPQIADALGVYPAKRKVRGFEVGAITYRVPGKAGHPSHARTLGHFHQNGRWNIRVEGGSGKS